MPIFYNKAFFARHKSLYPLIKEVVSLTASLDLARERLTFPREINAPPQGEVEAARK